MIEVFFDDGEPLLLDTEKEFYRDSRGWHRATFDTPVMGERMEFRTPHTRWYSGKVTRVSTT